jgi:acylphosphatase
MTKLNYNIKVTGRVQGVWFRDSTRKKALELELHGIVRNEADGSVYIEAEGQQDALDKLAAWCAVGPPAAEVEKVEVKPGKVKNYAGFEITR